MIKTKQKYLIIDEYVPFVDKTQKLSHIKMLTMTKVIELVYGVMEKKVSFYVRKTLDFYNLFFSYSMKVRYILLISL